MVIRKRNQGVNLVTQAMQKKSQKLMLYHLKVLLQKKTNKFRQSIQSPKRSNLLNNKMMLLIKNRIKRMTKIRRVITMLLLLLKTHHKKMSLFKMINPLNLRNRQNRKRVLKLQPQLYLLRNKMMVNLDKAVNPKRVSERKTLRNQKRMVRMLLQSLHLLCMIHRQRRMMSNHH